MPWLATAGLGAGLVAGSWYGLERPALQRLDVAVGEWLSQPRSRVLDRAVVATTDLGSVYAVFGQATALAAAGRRRMAADVVAVGVATWNIAQYNKRMRRRERPYEAGGGRRLVRAPTGSSYPSGHAAVSMATMTVLAEAAATAGRRDLLRLLGAYVATSRVYVGVHYPTDVIGGAGLGLAVGALWRGPVASLGRGVVAGSAAVGLRVGAAATRALRARRAGYPRR
jgi:undecaprenyl-diphosphatase